MKRNYALKHRHPLASLLLSLSLIAAPLVASASSTNTGAAGGTVGASGDTSAAPSTSGPGARVGIGPTGLGRQNDTISSSAPNPMRDRAEQDHNNPIEDRSAPSAGSMSYQPSYMDNANDRM